MAKRDRSARDSAYRELRSRILVMELPPGSKIDEQTLAEEVGSSRTPVREALIQLATEGLVVLGGSGGYFVSPIDLKDIRDLMEAQMLVARSTTHLLVARAEASDIEQLIAANQFVDEAVAAGNPALIAQGNAELHILESRLAGNPYILGLAERVYTNTQRLAYMSFRGAGPLSTNLTDHHRKVCRDHWEYVEAIGDRDIIRADGIATRHIDLFRGRIMTYLNQVTLKDMPLDDFIS